MSTQTENPAVTPEKPRETGRFQFGNPGGPGNPFARQVANLRKDIINFSTSEKIIALTTKIYTMAIEGSISAAKLFLSYAVGKPQPVIDPDQLDIEEWKIFRATAPMKEECAPMMAAGSPHTFLNQVRVVRPIVSTVLQQQITDFCEEKKKNIGERAKQEEAKARATEELLNSPGPELPDGLEKKLWANPEDDREAMRYLFGENGAQRPVANGEHAPSPNRKQRRAQARQQKKAKPSTNGHLQHS